MIDLQNQVNRVVLTTMATISASANGTGQSLNPYNSGLARLVVGVLSTAAGGTVDYKLQSSPDNSTWTDLGVSITTVSGAVLSRQDIGVDMRSLPSGSQYIRGVATLGGTSPSATVFADLYVTPETI